MNGFDENDEKEFFLHKSWRLEISLRQVELLRIIKILESVHSDTLAGKFKRLVYVRDVNDGTKTDFKRCPPKGDINKLIMSTKAYAEMIRDQREINEKMEVFYDGKVRQVD